MLFDLSNLPYWILLGIGVLLFLFIIVSGGGEDEVELDADGDLELDGSETPLDFDAEANELNATTVLGWLGIGKAPLMLLLATDLSLWGLLGWMLNVVIGGVVGTIISGLVGGVVLVTSLILALITGGQIARPLGQIFASFGEDASGDRLVGCIGTVSTGKIPLLSENKIGQVDVLDPARNLVTVNAAIPDWATIAPRRGEKVLVIDRSVNLYLVVVKDSPDQEQWFANSTTPTDRPRR